MSLQRLILFVGVSRLLMQNDARIWPVGDVHRATAVQDEALVEEEGRESCYC